MIQFHSLLGNSQKLDGGSMFGNAPKPMWERWMPADEKNRIPLATRALLVETSQHKILFETGIGAYLEPKLRDRYGVQEAQHVLLESLAAKGLSPGDITDIIISHLHFDHAGGLLSEWQEGETPQLLFSNARYYAGKEAWERAQNPHPRDRASFIPFLQEQLIASQRFSTLEATDILRFDELEVHFIQSDGHTPGMLCSDLRWNQQRLVFAADLIPGTAWVHLPITMGYDRFAEQVIDEKRQLLEALSQDGGWLFYTHDPQYAMSQVQCDPNTHKFSPKESVEVLDLQV